MCWKGVPHKWCLILKGPWTEGFCAKIPGNVQSFLIHLVDHRQIKPFLKRTSIVFSFLFLCFFHVCVCVWSTVYYDSKDFLSYFFRFVLCWIIQLVLTAHAACFLCTWICLILSCNDNPKSHTRLKVVSMFIWFASVCFHFRFAFPDLHLCSVSFLFLVTTSGDNLNLYCVSASCFLLYWVHLYKGGLNCNQVNSLSVCTLSILLYWLHLFVGRLNWSQVNSLSVYTLCFVLYWLHLIEWRLSSSQVKKKEKKSLKLLLCLYLHGTFPCTQKGSNEHILILTWTHSMHIFREIPFVKPQNDT